MIFIILTIITCIFFYDSLVSETMHSVSKCLEVIVPSLYGSMFLACLAVECRLHDAAGKIFSLPSRYIFKMKPEVFSVFLISCISGYPSGAKLLKNMLDNNEIKSDEFTRYCSCCYSAGPAFVSGTAAYMSGMFSAGTIIYISCFLSSLFIAVISGIHKDVPEKNKRKIKCTVSCSSVIKAADSASRGIIQMCIIIISFSVFKIMLINSGAAALAANILSGITYMSENNCYASVLSLAEITNISLFRSCSPFTLSVMAALYSTGGICVIMQIFSITGESLDRKKFIIWRIAGSLSSGIFCSLICRIFLKSAVASVSTFQIHSSDTPLFPSVLLIIMSIMLISCDTQTKSQKNKAVQ